MKNTLIQLGIGASGIGATEIVANAIPSDPSNVVEVTNIIIQIVISIVTLFGLFKRKKVTNKIKN